MDSVVLKDQLFCFCFSLVASRGLLTTGTALDAACCMVRPRCSSVTAVLGRLSGLASPSPLSPGRVSVSRGREFLLSLASG